MCRHCERIKEDVKDKQIVHDFMKSCAEKINRKIKESRELGSFSDLGRLVRPVEADDIELKIEVTAEFMNSFGLILDSMHK